jgi:hypothetical protein
MTKIILLTIAALAIAAGSAVGLSRRTASATSPNIGAIASEAVIFATTH